MNFREWQKLSYTEKCNIFFRGLVRLKGLA